jgi:ABC-2 type transport system ATP-binding protein
MGSSRGGGSAVDRVAWETDHLRRCARTRALCLGAGHRTRRNHPAPVSFYTTEQKSEVETPSMDHVIVTEHLSKIYVQDFLTFESGRPRLNLRRETKRREALRDLNLSVRRGEIFGLLGPNGAGKTTAIKILMGIHFPTRGSAKILGRPLGDKRAKAQVGYLPENPYFYDYLTGGEFLDYYGRLYGMGRVQRRAKIPELLERVGLSASVSIPLRGYSKGMLQRIGIAQALLNDPEIVVLDEPQSGLDPIGRKEIRDIILSLREQGKTVFFSSHILQDAEMVCDRVAILHLGDLVKMGHLEELLTAHVSEFEIVASGMSGDAIAEVEKTATRTLRRADDVLFVIKKRGDADAALAKISTCGGTLVAFTPRRETLEDIFLKQVGRGTREVAGAAGGEVA